MKKTKYEVMIDLSYVWCVMHKKWEIIIHDEVDWFPFSMEKLLEAWKIEKI